MRALVCDLDGTLIDSIPSVAKAVNLVLGALGYRTLSSPEITRCVGEGAQVMFERALQIVDGDQQSISQCLERYIPTYLAETLDQTQSYPGVEETLCALHDQGVVLGICTNKPRATTLPALEAVGLSDLFPVVVTADDTGHRKPDGRHVTETLARMNISCDEAAFVGDSETDVLAGKDAGVWTILMSYGYCHLPMEALGADRILGQFTDVPSALENIAL